MQLARRKCMAEVCLDVKENDFGERLSLFAAFFLSEIDFGDVDTREA